MATPRRKPLFIAGTPRSSGDVQTGEITWTRGGGRAASFLSGQNAGDALIYGGAGRLNTLLVLTAAPSSGSTVLFYDSAVATSGGPFLGSGHKTLAVIPPLFSPSPTSGLSPFAVPGYVGDLDVPFQSGLCVACVSRSGSAGFAVTYTPESSQLDDGGVTGA